MGLLESLLLVLKVIAGGLLLVVQVALGMGFYILPVVIMGGVFVYGHDELVDRIGRWRANIIAALYLLVNATLLVWLYTNWTVIDLTQYWPS